LDHEGHGLFGALRDARVADVRATAGTENYDASDPDDEYPLPPDNGPALRGVSEVGPSVSPVLLALRESPLVLAPTLTIAPPDRTALASTSPAASGFGAPLQPADPATSSTVLVGGGGQMAEGGVDQVATAGALRRFASLRNNVPIDLSAFLDL